MNYDHIFHFLTFVINAQKPVWGGKNMYLELTAMHKNGKDMFTKCYKYHDNLAAELVQFIAGNQSFNDFNVYCGIVPRKIPVQKHASKNETADQTCLLWLDIDNVDPTKWKETINRLPFPPSLAVWSGHGLQCYFLTSSPFDDPRAERIMSNLAKEFGADKACSDISRMLRIPGTINCKPKKQPVWSMICDYTGKIYKPEDFAKWDTQDLSSSVNVNDEQVQKIAQAISTPSLEVLVESSILSNRIKQIIKDGKDPSDPDNDDRSDLIQSVITGMLAIRWSDEIIAKVLTYRSFAISKKIFEEHEGDRVGAAKYIARSIQNARKYLEENPFLRTDLLDVDSFEELREFIINPLLSQRRKNNHFQQDIAAAIKWFFQKVGQFIYVADENSKEHTGDADEHSIYWMDKDRKIACLTDKKIEKILRIHCGLPDEGGLHESIRSLFRDLITLNYKQLKPARLSRVSEYKNGNFYIYQGNGNVCKISKDRIETIRNGDDGVFFLPEKEESEWRYVEGHTGNYLMDMLPLSIDPNCPLNENESQLAVTTWTVANFMRGMIRHHALLNLIGPQGSGKTTVAENIARIITGNEKFTSMGMPDSSRDFVAVARNNGVLIFDNVEGYQYKWNFEDHLARIYQRGTISERKLYTNNEEVRFQTNSFVALTAIHPGWGRSDVASRSIVINLAPWHETKKSQKVSQSEHTQFLMQHRNEIMTEIANSLQKLLQHLENQPLENYRINHRMESYPQAICAWLIANGVMKNKEEFENFWSKIVDEQDSLVSIDSYAITLVEDFVKELISQENGVLQGLPLEPILLDPPKSRSGKKIARVKAETLFEYLVNVRPEVKLSYSGYKRFRGAVLNADRVLARMGIIVKPKRINQLGHFLEIDFTRYAENNLLKASQAPNEVGTLTA